MSPNDRATFRPARVLRAALAGLIALTVAGCSRSEPKRAEVPEPDAPGVVTLKPGATRLAVLVVFDQMRADYVERWRDLWGEGGFRRLLADGASFSACHYPYACTETGPGHASLATGRTPDRHGIVANAWYDRQAKAIVYSVAGTRPYQGVPAGAAGEGPSTPERLIGPSIADALRDASGRQSRVVSLSLKDRPAVFMGGRKPDACYWFDLWTGGFMTSTYYRDRPHPWVTDFDAGRPSARWFGKDWVRLRTDLDYEARSGPDHGPGEATGWIQGKTFPHPLNGGLKQLGKEPFANRDYHGALFTSPFGNDLLLEFARKAIAAERLGSGPMPDLLCLGFSSLDAIGHSWGPDSQEMLDAMLRADRVVAELLTTLDAQVGPGKYTLVLTSDHGVCPLPEVSRARKQEAGRVSVKHLTAEADAILQAAHSPPGTKDRWVAAIAETWFYLDPAVLALRKVKPADAQATLARGLKGQPGVLAAYTHTELVAGTPEGPIGRAVRRSFHPERSGDVGVVLRPYYILADDLVGTGHSSPHSYDTHVPLLVYGPGVAPGPRTDPVSPLVVPGILSAALGMAPPEGAESPVPPLQANP